jgi:hypothetical protein
MPFLGNTNHGTGSPKGKVTMSNKRMESARKARPTRNGEAPLLAAHSQRWASRENNDGH